MKKTLLLFSFVLLSLILVFTLIGCGGGSDKNTGVTQSGDSYNNEFDKGGISITVNWPAAKKSIPSATTKIKVNIYESFGGIYQTVVPETVITRESTASSKTTTITGIPLGAKTALAQAYDSSNTELAYATLDVTIQAGDNATATLTLANGQFPGFGTTAKHAYVVNQNILSRDETALKGIRSGGGNVTKINQSTYGVVKTISLPSSSAPYQAGILSDGSKVFITDSGANKIHIIQTSDDSVSYITSPGATTYINIAGNTAYFSSSSTEEIFVLNNINTSNPTWGTSISGSDNNYLPKGILYYNNYIYGVLVNQISSSYKAFKIDTFNPSIGGWANLSYEPAGPAAINTNSELAYMPYIMSGYGGLFVINRSTGLKSDYSLGFDPFAIALSPNQNYIYMTDITNNYLRKYLASDFVISSRQKTIILDDYVSVGTDPTNIALGSEGTKIWVVNNGSNSVTVVNASNFSVLASSISVGSSPEGIALQP